MSLWQKVGKLLAGQEAEKIKGSEKETANDFLVDAETKIFQSGKKAQPAKQALPATLKVVSGDDTGMQVNLSGKRTNIGRATSSELLLTDPGISRLHAFVLSEDGCHVIYDGRSMNGTYVNGMRSNKKILQHGDAVKIANTVLVYELE